MNNFNSLEHLFNFYTHWYSLRSKCETLKVCHEILRERESSTIILVVFLIFYEILYLVFYFLNFPYSGILELKVKNILYYSNFFLRLIPSLGIRFANLDLRGSMFFIGFKTENPNKLSL